MNEKLEEDRKIQARSVLSFLIIIGILLVTGLGVTGLILSKRKAEEKPKDRIAPAVEVSLVQARDYQVKLTTQGVVESSRETRLAAEVAGKVREVSVNLKRGGMVKKGEILVKMDAADYRSALAASEVSLAEAELALEQERARVQQAQLDWKKLGKGEPVNALVLRAPYLKAAEARAASAQENVARARRDVERTEIVAPFDAGIRSAGVEVGAFAGAGKVVAELYASEELEVRLPLGLEDFGFLDRDSGGNVGGKVILSGKIGKVDYEWKAQLLRVDPEIDRKNLSASVVVKVLKNADSKFPLPPVGLFVTAEIDGMELPGVAEVPRRGLLEGGRVMVVGQGNKIEFREVEILRLSRDSVVIGKGLLDGEKIVLTRLSTPVTGMEVTIEELAESEVEK